MTVSSKVITAAEKDAFNAFLATHAKGHILQTWEWGEVKAATGWQPIRLMIYREGTPIAAVSLLKRPLPGGFYSIFYSPRGPVLDIQDEEAWQTLLQCVKEQAKKHRAVFWKSDPDIPEGNTEWEKAYQKAGFRKVDKGPGFEGVQPRHVFRLDISPDIETLLANCHQKTRYNIRLAGKKGVTITKPGREALPEFYRILKETADRDKFLIRPYHYYEVFYDKLVPAGQAELFMAYWEGQAIAGTLAFVLGDKSWYIYGASSNAHRNVMPNYLIQWTMIEWAKAKGCTMYDFRGVPGDVDESHPLYGLVKFKKGFNGVYTSFMGEYDLVYKPFVYHAYNFLEPLYQKGVRKLIRLKKKLTGRG